MKGTAWYLFVLCESLTSDTRRPFGTVALASRGRC